MYTLLPKAAGGRLFSDEMGRIAFIMLLVISVPIGFHHLYMDPFQAAGWKALHMFGTFLVMLPTLFTGFTIIASLEVSGRLRGGKGLFGWIKALPWGDPLVASAVLGLLLLTVGGWGGMINASYAMNSMVHNTQWVTGHFHLIFGGMVIILYFGIAYHLWPKLTGRVLAAKGLAISQLWLWFIGMIVTTAPWHIIGLQGQPRRISSTPYDSPLVQVWQAGEAIMIVGGTILVISASLFIVVLVKTHGNAQQEEGTNLEFAMPIKPVLSLPNALNGFAIWIWIILVYIVASYGYPIAQFFLMPTYGAFPWSI
jgi:cytochrome c oxidase subunit 1